MAVHANITRRFALLGAAASSAALAVPAIASVRSLDPTHGMTPLQRRDFPLAEMLKAASEVDPSILADRTVIRFSDPTSTRCAFLITGERPATAAVQAGEREARRRDFNAQFKRVHIPGAPELATL